MTTFKPARAAKPATLRTLADLDILLRTMPEIEARDRQDMVSALATLARAASKPLCALPVQADALRPILKGLPAAMAGVSEGRWRNVRSLLSRALNLAQVTRSTGVFRNPRSPAWAACFARVSDYEARYRLSRLSGFCSLEGIEPEHVNDAVLARFLEALKLDPLIANPHAKHKSAIQAWNARVNADASWPGGRLWVPDRRNHYAVPIDKFPPSLERDIQSWLCRLAGKDLCDGQDFKPLSDRSIKGRTELIRNLTSAMVRGNIKAASLQTLADVVIPEHVAKALEFVRGRVGGQWSGQTQQLAHLAYSIARHHVGADPAQLKRLAQIRRKVTPVRRGMTDRNRALLRPLDDPGRMQTLLCLPGRLFEEVRHSGPPSVELARLLRGAVALEILIMAPVRLQNLLMLRLGEDLLPGPRGALTLALASGQTKNREPFEAMLPSCSARMVKLYLERYQPLLTQTASPWLFPNRAGEGPIAPENLRLQIKKLARERAGVALTPHLFRHIAVKLTLAADPGAYGRARLMLGHRSVKTTETFYAGTETRAAMDLYGAHVLRMRQLPQHGVPRRETR